MHIHKTAIISPKAKVADDVSIGPYSVIEEGAELGPGCCLSPNVYVCKDTIVGAGCMLYMGVCLGEKPQDLAFKNRPSRLIVGKNNVFREHVTVHRGTEEGSVTEIGDDNYFMCLSHIGHNCKLGNKIIVCNNTLLAGYVEIQDMAFVSASCLIHQFVRIGTMAMIGGGVRLNKDFPPYMRTAADNIVESYNIIGLRRAGYPADIREDIKKAYRILYRQGYNTEHAIKLLKASSCSRPVQEVIDFIIQSKRGVCTSRSNRQP
jgi:UDP-N-acetylglucosamine acyltransferase